MPSRSAAALRVMLVDDHPIVRRGVRNLLVEAFPTSAIEEVGLGAEAVAKVRSHRWDLVILDLTLPDGSGLDVLKRVREMHARLPVLILSMHASEQFARRAIAAGASGYLTKDTADTELITAVTRIARGSKYFGHEILEEVALGLHPDRLRPDKRLSEREYEVFSMISRGKTVSAIAIELGLSIKTVSTYRKRVLEKMNMSSNAELYRYAVHHSLAD
jgi:two-component system, NarL family, invasion response regulator UvrY